MELQRAISFDRNVSSIGRRMTVLVDEVLDQDAEHVAVGRTVGQAADVDGVTHLIGSGDWRPGDFAEARIIEAHDYDLVAEIIGHSSEVESLG